LTRETILRFLNEVLYKVSKPSRYIGGEMNSIFKEPAGRLRVLLIFPDAYEVGMSHHGLRILYDILNEQDWIYAERAFLPWVDMMEEMKKRKIPLFSLETKTPASDFDVLAFSLQYELVYPSFLATLELAGLPTKAEARRDDDPIVVAGGPCATNPEPVAEFVDAFGIGDGEEMILDICRVLHQTKGMKRAVRLKELSKIKGVYVPTLYALENKGRFIVPMGPKVKIRRVERPTKQPVRQIVPFMEIVHDRGIVEVMRGCTRGCRFCQAGMIYRPVRELWPQEIEEITKELLENTGYEQISLLSLSTMDHTGIKEILERLRPLMKEHVLSLSLPSTRVGRFGVEIAETISSIRRTGLTLAPEAGSQRLRNVINKNVREEELLESLHIARSRGWKRVKLYFMMGLPTERDEDIYEMVKLVKKVRRLMKEVTVNVSVFIPKAHTPFQFAAFMNFEDYRRRLRILRDLKRYARVKVADYHQSLIEAVLSRGDRKLSKVLMSVREKGALFDEWEDRFNYSMWQEAFQEENLDMNTYLESIEPSTHLPWDHVDTGLEKDFLVAEYEKALHEDTTPDCRFNTCTGCGVCNSRNVHNRLYLK